MKELIDNFDAKIAPLTSVGTHGVTLAGDIKMKGPSYVYSTYPEEWQNKYSSMAFMITDPTIIWAARNIGCIRWSELKTYGLKKVFREARDFNINYGAVFATKSNKVKCFMTMARDDRDLTDSEMDVCMTVFTSLTEEAFAVPVLSNDDVELIALLAEGLSLNELGDRLGLGVTGVRYRKKKLFSLLGVKNEAQAVRVAMRRNIID